MSVPPVVVDPAREEAELVAYLGDDYDRERLVHYEHGLEAEAAAIGDEATLYRTSQAYLYNLTAFAMTQTKAPYLAALAAAVPAGARVLDYGCGIGSDGLALLEAGYDVAFADFDNPSVRYLRWRLEHRGLSAPIYDLERDEVPAGFDLAYAFDVIEHVDDPFAFLAALERRARLVLVNFLHEAQDDTRLHRVLPIRRLLLHAARHRLRRYRLHYGRSHLVLYESRRVHGFGRLRSLAVLGAGRLASR